MLRVTKQQQYRTHRRKIDTERERDSSKFVLELREREREKATEQASPCSFIGSANGSALHMVIINCNSN